MVLKSKRKLYYIRRNNEIIKWNFIEKPGVEITSYKKIKQYIGQIGTPQFYNSHFDFSLLNLLIIYK